ncbi:MAG: hypothetical protein IJB03_05690 [Alistipes sp.]|nr:hypothetical protein [Alistipes sp.]MBQ3249136.1 hypothetical protein [Alistipes sp.]MBR3827357.1 hypothetical protein [Alistipes sp.]
MKRIISLVVAAGAMLFVSCNQQLVTNEAFHPVKCEFLNAEGDGSITLRAYGQGRHRGDAIEQARKNAVREVMLVGVNVPGDHVMSRPLITEVNAEEKYAAFLNDFFKDDSDYKQFVSKRDRRHNSNEKHWSGTQMKISTTVRVLRADLEQYLRENGIIK